MRIWKAWTIGAVVIAAVAIAGAGVYRARSQQVNVVTVNGQGIPVALYEQAQTQTAALQTRYPGYFKQFGNINRLIEDLLVNQEAARRGLTCDGASYAATEVALLTQVPTGIDDMLRDADLEGVMFPPGYLTTPGPARTPSTLDALATYVANPDVIKGYSDICTRAALYRAVTTPGATNDQRNAAIDALLAQLRANAHIVGAADTPTPAPPPAATTTDTPVPGLPTATP